MNSFNHFLFLRNRTEAELTQKLKKETRKLYTYEQAMLLNYQKYLRLLEKNALRRLLICSVSLAMLFIISRLG